MSFGSSTGGMPGSGVSSGTGADECPLFGEEHPTIAPRLKRTRANCTNLVETLELHIALDGSPYCGRDHSQLSHQLLELGRVQRLGPVAERLFGVVVHLNQQSVGPRGYGGSRHGRNLVA